MKSFLKSHFIQTLLIIDILRTPICEVKIEKNGMLIFNVHCSILRYICSNSKNAIKILPIIFCDILSLNRCYLFIRYGRKPVILVCSLVYGVFGLTSAYVTNYYGFLVLRVLVGFVHHTYTHLPFILGKSISKLIGIQNKIIKIHNVLYTYLPFVFYVC